MALVLAAWRMAEAAAPEFFRFPTLKFEAHREVRLRGEISRHCSGQPRMNANAREWNCPENPDSLFIRVYSRPLAVLDVSSHDFPAVRSRASDSFCRPVFARRIGDGSDRRKGVASARSRFFVTRADHAAFEVNARTCGIWRRWLTGGPRSWSGGCSHHEEHEGHEDVGRTRQEPHFYFFTSGS
jgi:hypothetical protein